MNTTRRLLPGVLATIGSILLFLDPQAAAQGAAEGLARCRNVIIPSLFPFFVLCPLVLTGPLGRWIGIGLTPVCRSLGLPGGRIASALLSGWIGGFAVAARSAQQGVEEGWCSPAQAGILLAAGCVSSPAFLISGVGAALFGSIPVGICLYAAQLIASWLAAAAVSHLFPPAHSTACSAKFSTPNFSSTMSHAVSSTILVCGYVVFFGVIVRSVPCPKGLRPLLAALLEVTAGCDAAAHRNCTLLACVSVSILGACCLAQVSGLVKKTVPLYPLLWSRLLHLPLMAGLLQLFLRLWPGQTTVWVGGSRLVLPRWKMPADVCVLVFVLSALVCGCQWAWQKK